MTDLVTLQPLELEHFSIGPTGLTVKGTPTYDEWAHIGGLLQLFDVGVSWAIGDWIAWGEAQYGELAAHMIDARHLSESSRRVYAWVAKKIPPGNRNHAVSFGHHQLVAELPVDAQRVWLDKAVAGDGEQAWGCQRLKQELALARGEARTMEWGVYVGFDSMADRDRVAQEHERAGRLVRCTERAK